ncbi:protein FMC1 homolog [Glandiceps talaboti]
MAASHNIHQLKILRSLIRELRLCNKNRPVRQTLAYNYIIDQYRNHQITSEKICKGENEMQHKAQTYLSMLHNVRRYQELHAEYRGEGERSVESTAQMMGFELPTKPDTSI